MNEYMLMKKEEYERMFCSWYVNKEPTIIFEKAMIKALKKFLRMQKKNRRRWGG